MLDEFATAGSLYALVHFLEEPVFMIDKTLHGFLHQGFGVATLMGGQAG